MDNLTHSLTGLALSRAGLNRFCPHGTLLMIVAVNVPDIDMLSWLKGRLCALEWHRGYTHSLAGMPVMALAAVVFTALLTRTRLPWLVAWLIACVGVASHLLLDTSMSYGVRLLLPFSSKWLHLDIFTLTDWVLLAVLVLVWAAPAFGKLVGEEIGDRRTGGQGVAIFAIAFLVAYGGFRATMHQRALAQLSSRIFDDVLEGPAHRIAAFPNSINPFSWYGVVEGEHAYRLYDVEAYGNFDPAAGTLVYKPNWTATLQKVSETAAFRYILYFSRFPYWQEIQESGNNADEVVVFSDLRFGPPGESFLTVRAFVNPAGKVVDVKFGRQ